MCDIDSHMKANKALYHTRYIMQLVCFYTSCKYTIQGERYGGTFAHNMHKTHNTTTSRTNPGTEAEPQQIVAQRLLSCLQYHVPIKSSTEDLTRPTFGNTLK